MKTQILREFLPGCILWVLLSGCVVTDEPSVEDALGKLSELPVPAEDPINPAPDIFAVESKSVTPNPAQERRIQAMAHFSAGVSYEVRREKKKASDEFFQAGMADTGDSLIGDIFLSSGYD